MPPDGAVAASAQMQRARAFGDSPTRASSLQCLSNRRGCSVAISNLSMGAQPAACSTRPDSAAAATRMDLSTPGLFFWTDRRAILELALSNSFFRPSAPRHTVRYQEVCADLETVPHGRANRP